MKTGREKKREPSSFFFFLRLLFSLSLALLSLLTLLSLSLSLSSPALPPRPPPPPNSKQTLLSALLFSFGGKHGLRRRQEPNQRGLRHGLRHRVALSRRCQAGDCRAHEVEAAEGDDQGPEGLLGLPADRADARPVAGVGGVDGGEHDQRDGSLQRNAEKPGARDRGGEVGEGRGRRLAPSVAVAVVVVVSSLSRTRSGGGRERTESGRGEASPPLGRGRRRGGAGADEGEEGERPTGETSHSGGRATASTMVMIDSRNLRSVPRSCFCSSVGPLLRDPRALEPRRDFREHVLSREGENFLDLEGGRNTRSAFFFSLEPFRRRPEKMFLLFYFFRMSRNYTLFFVATGTGEEGQGLLL